MRTLGAGRRLMDQSMAAWERTRVRLAEAPGEEASRVAGSVMPSARPLRARLSRQSIPRYLGPPLRYCNVRHGLIRSIR